MPHNTLERKITQTSKSKASVVLDHLAVESPLEIRLGHSLDRFHSLAITLCSPDEIDDLIHGYLYTEGIISSANDINSIAIFDNELGLIAEVCLKQTVKFNIFLNKRHGMVHASCGLCGKTEFDQLLTFHYKNYLPSNIIPNATVIQSLPSKLRKQQGAFQQTGGLHACALFDADGTEILIKEDIGRHNALDKLIGSALRQELVPLNNGIVLLSGRVSFELVHKSLMAGICHLAAIGAPSSLSVEIASINGLNLMGFVKQNGYNVY